MSHTARMLNQRVSMYMPKKYFLGAKNWLRKGSRPSGSGIW